MSYNDDIGILIITHTEGFLQLKRIICSTERGLMVSGMVRNPSIGEGQVSSDGYLSWREMSDLVVKHRIEDYFSSDFLHQLLAEGKRLNRSAQRKLAEAARYQRFVDRGGSAFAH